MGCAPSAPAAPGTPPSGPATHAWKTPPQHVARRTPGDKQSARVQRRRSFPWTWSAQPSAWHVPEPLPLSQARSTRRRQPRARWNCLRPHRRRRQGRWGAAKDEEKDGDVSTDGTSSADSDSTCSRDQRAAAAALGGAQPIEVPAVTRDGKHKHVKLYAYRAKRAARRLAFIATPLHGAFQRKLGMERGNGPWGVGLYNYRVVRKPLSSAAVFQAQPLEAAQAQARLPATWAPSLIPLDPLGTGELWVWYDRALYHNRTLRTRDVLEFVVLHTQLYGVSQDRHRTFLMDRCASVTYATGYGSLWVAQGSTDVRHCAQKTVCVYMDIGDGSPPARVYAGTAHKLEAAAVRTDVAELAGRFTVFSTCVPLRTPRTAPVLQPAADVCIRGFEAALLPAPSDAALGADSSSGWWVYARDRTLGCVAHRLHAVPWFTVRYDPAQYPRLSACGCVWVLRLTHDRLVVLAKGSRDLLTFAGMVTVPHGQGVTTHPGRLTAAIMTTYNGLGVQAELRFQHWGPVHCAAHVQCEWTPTEPHPWADVPRTLRPTSPLAPHPPGHRPLPPNFAMAPASPGVALLFRALSAQSADELTAFDGEDMGNDAAAAPTAAPAAPPAAPAAPPAAPPARELGPRSVSPIVGRPAVLACLPPPPPALRPAYLHSTTRERTQAPASTGAYTSMERRQAQGHASTG